MDGADIYWQMEIIILDFIKIIKDTEKELCIKKMGPLLVKDILKMVYINELNYNVIKNKFKCKIFN